MQSYDFFCSIAFIMSLNLDKLYFLCIFAKNNIKLYNLYYS